jgi:hypothetical protein
MAVGIGAPMHPVPRVRVGLRSSMARSIAGFTIAAREGKREGSSRQAGALNLNESADFTDTSCAQRPLDRAARFVEDGETAT